MAENILPSSYEEWRHCITVKCKVALTAEYVERRIATLRDAGADETQTFRRLYGDGHWRAVLGWFERARTEIN
jgi:hypothetical protein